jgi:signal transduction histidine kinase
MVESLLNEKEPDYKITREFLTDINKEIDRLTRLIKNLMELTRMDKMKELNRTEFNLTDLIEEVVEKLEPLAKQKQLTVNIRAPQNFEVYMDYERIFHMVANLVDNAFKYNIDNGVVEISCKREDNNVVLTISDTGIGIPEENIPSIFERFVRVEKSRTRESGGFGLGLALVKEIVELHEGKIEVESTINEGTTFKVILPDVKHG